MTCPYGEPMTWFRVDDQSAFHAKVLKAGNEAWGAVCRAGAWSSAQLTDGFVPEHVALQIGSRELWCRARDAGENGQVGLVEEVPNGWQIHDYLDWNPSAKVVKKQRKHAKKRVDQWRKVKRECNGVTNALQDRSCNGSVTPPPSRPVPTRPYTDPDPPSGEAGGEAIVPPVLDPKPERKRRGRAPSIEIELPKDFVPAPATVAFAIKHGRDVERVLEELVIWADLGHTSKDWQARLRQFILTAERQGSNPLRTMPSGMQAPPRNPSYPQHALVEPPKPQSREQIAALADMAAQTSLDV